MRLPSKPWEIFSLRLPLLLHFSALPLQCDKLLQFFKQFEQLKKCILNVYLRITQGHTFVALSQIFILLFNCKLIISQFSDNVKYKLQLDCIYFSTIIFCCLDVCIFLSVLFLITVPMIAHFMNKVKNYFILFFSFIQRF